jgi:hypothetical protein
MTQQTSGYRDPIGHPGDPSRSADPSGNADQSRRDTIREQGAEVGRTTGEVGQRVAGTAAEQAGQVGREARRQARDLLGQAREQVTEQTRNGQHSAASGLRSVAEELHEMASGGERQGAASDLAQQAADKLGEFADWLSRREPADVLDEVRALARRKPGAFLLGAAVAGVLAGRLTRGAVDADRDPAGRNDGEQPGPGIGPSPRVGSMSPVPPAPPADPVATAPGYPAGPSSTGSIGDPTWVPPEPGHRSAYAGSPPPVPSAYHPADESTRIAADPTTPVGEHIDQLNRPDEERPEAGGAR